MSDVRQVTFLHRKVPVLSCTDLAVFKALFNRTKAWADIEEMLAARTVDSEQALNWLIRLLGPDDEATVRFTVLANRERER